MKKKTKKLILLAVCAVLVLGGITAAVIVSKTYVPHAREYAAQFAAAREDYDAAAAFLNTLTEEEPASPVTISIPTVGEDDTILFFRDNKDQRVTTIAIKPEERAHLDAVERAFAACGFVFKNARAENGNVTFTAMENAYQICFVADDEKPQTEHGRVKRMDACWYQIIG